MERYEKKQHPWKLGLILLAVITIVLWLISCRAVTNPPAYLIAEIPALELPTPYIIESNRKPKDRPGMIKMPFWKIHKSELTKKQIRKWNGSQ